MQRSITYKKPLVAILLFFLFIIYESLSSIYLFLPPMLAVLLVLFVKSIQNRDVVLLTFISLLLLIYEADKGYHAFSIFIYFFFLYKYILPIITQSINCNICIKFFYVVLAYLGLYLFSYLLSSIFLIPAPSMNYYIVYYMIIEFIIVSIL
jgi:hypothetical protein